MNLCGVFFYIELDTDIFVSYIPVGGRFNFSVRECWDLHLWTKGDNLYIMFRITSPSVGNKYVGLFNVGFRICVATKHQEHNTTKSND